MSFRTAYGNKYSENRWRMCNRDECVLVPGPYMNTAPLRRGPAEVALGEFVRRHHTQVEPIIGPVWGWSLYNDVGNSNHLAGTAIDLRATVRPWGARVLSKHIIDKTYALLNSPQFVVDGQSGLFWGREWSRADEMHFQLRWREGDPRNDRMVAQLRGHPITPPPVPVPGVPGVWFPLLQYGSRGSAVLELQKDMNRIFPSYPMMKLAEDGEFGPNTLSAVIEFQRRYNSSNPGEDLLVDGILGPKTWAALNKFGVKL
jgi:hypothetical protein